MLTYLRRKMKTIMIAVAVVFAASMFYGVTASRMGGGGVRPSDALAKVNGKKVDPFRFREIMSRLLNQVGEEMRPQDLAFVQNLALGQTVDFMLILEQAKGQVRVSKREVNMALDNVIKKEKLASQQDLESALKRMGLTLSRFRNMMNDEMLVQKMVYKIKSEVSVTPDDLREVRASHILVTSEVEAAGLLARVQKGEKFGALAKEYSKDPGSAVQGGDLGYFTTGLMVEPFEKAAFATPVGEVSGIVRSPFGFHIIKVTDSRLRKFKEEVKDIDKAVKDEKQERAFQKWFSGIRAEAKVEVINPALKAHDLRFKGRMAEAVAEYQKAIAQDPANPLLRIFLGDTYATIGKTELAVSEYEAAISIDGGNPDLYILLAQFYEKAGESKEAVKQYKRASLVSGDNKARHEQLLKIFEELKAWDQVNREKAEIARIEKKEAFEKELRGEE
ncbi:peptidylprolyl isomerase [Candidatus Margulisiibacteriota bacterium]